MCPGLEHERSEEKDLAMTENSQHLHINLKCLLHIDTLLRKLP